MSELPAEARGTDLSEDEKRRIRAEIRYAALVAQEARPAEKPKTLAEKVLAYLSNGFVLLLIGSLITSYLVPQFQRAYEDRNRRSSLKQECLVQFLLYSNSLWQEYYAILPLTLQTDLEKAEYLRYMTEISQIKLKRYEAFSRVQALALIFREQDPGRESAPEQALSAYAVHVNEVSAAIDQWLSDLYCTPTKRLKSPCAKFDPTFDPYHGYLKIKGLTINLGNDGTQKVTELMVQGIKSPR